MKTKINTSAIPNYITEVSDKNISNITQCTSIVEESVSNIIKNKNFTFSEKPLLQSETYIVNKLIF